MNAAKERGVVMKNHKLKYLLLVITGITLGVTIFGCGRVDAPNPWTTYPGGYVTDLAFDSTGSLWVAARGYTAGSATCGIKKYNGTKWDNYSVADGFPTVGIWSIAVDADDKVWVGADDGVLKFNDFTSRSWEWVGLRGKNIRAILVDPSGNKWFGSDAGLVKYDGANWTTYTATSDGLANDSIECMFLDHNGNIWIGTNGGGVSRFDRVSNWKTFTSAQGLINNWPETIVEDNANNIWVGYTSYGGIENQISKYDGSIWTSYGSGEGYGGRGVTFSSALDKKGNLWFGTDRGVYKYDGTAFTHFWLDETDHTSGANLAWAAVVDSNNNKWFGVSGDYIFRYSGD